MSESETKIRVLDSAYQPFPDFEHWSQELAVDTVRWDRYYSALKTSANTASPEILNRARDVAKRAAALDTGAIEGLYEVDRGFTYTVALETAGWEAALAEKGSQVRPLFEAQLHAYDYVLDLATKAEAISEASIRTLHVEVCRAQDTYRVMTAVGPQEQPLPKGQYKVLPNHVRTRKGTDHSYAPVDVTPDEMHRLATELRSAPFLSAHPVLQAAYAHYCLVVIHPFADGNGRVARALASAFTYRAISMPIVILSEQKNQYLDALETSDAGDYQPFADFILDRCLDTITLVDESLRSAATESAESSAAAIQTFYVTRGGYTHEQVDQVGKSLAEAFLNTVNDNMNRIKAHAPKVVFRSTMQNATYGIPSGFRLPIDGGRSIVLTLTAQAPVRATQQRHYVLMLPQDAASDDDIQIVRQPGTNPDNTFAVRIDQLTPTISGIVHIRLKMAAERIANDMFAELKKHAAKTMGRKL